MNQTLKNIKNDAAKAALKQVLLECTEPQQKRFKILYSEKKVRLRIDEISIDEVIEQMDGHQIDWAYTQAERTIQRNRETLSNIKTLSSLSKFVDNLKNIK